MSEPPDRRERITKNELFETLTETEILLAQIVEGAKAERRPGYLFHILPAVPFPNLNGVITDGIDAAQVVSDLEAVITEVEALNLPFGLQVPPHATNVIEEATRLGLQQLGALPLMTIEADRFHVDRQTDLEIRRPVNPDELAEAEAITSASFGVPKGKLICYYNQSFAGSPSVNIYLGYIEGKPVNTATTVRVNDAIGIYNVCTPHEFRGHGYGAAITAHAIQEGFAAGARTAWLQSTPIAESLYKKIGFRIIEQIVVMARSS
jgi:N-acetylglutamate synthase